MFKSVIHLSIILCLSVSCLAQEPKWSWAVGGGDFGFSTGNAVVVDAKGAVFVVGSFTGQFNIDTITLQSNGGSKDVFLAKFNNEGSVLWAKKYGGSRPDQGTSIAIDSEGAIYIGGTFIDSTIIGNSSLLSYGQEDIFLSQLDSDGNVMWVQNAGSSYPDYIGFGNGSGGGIVISGTSIYIAGGFDANGQSPPSHDTMNIGSSKLVSKGSLDIFLACYSKSGTFKWAKNAGGVNGDIAAGISVDRNHNIYVTGNFDWPYAYFDSIKVTSVVGPFQDAFVAKYDSSGNIVWARGAGGRLPAGGQGIVCDDSDGVYITGDYTEAISFGGAHLNTIDHATFIAKYNALNGAIKWASTSGSYGPNYGSGIVLDKSSNPIITGAFVDNNVFGSTTLSTTGPSDVFVAKYDQDGNALWAKQTDGTGDVAGSSIACDTSDNVYVTGVFRSAYAAFGIHAINNGGSPGTSNMFLAKLSPSTTGIAPISSRGKPVISPNPASNYLTIRQGSKEYTNYCIANTLGQQIASGVLDSKREQTIQLNGITNGFYYMTLTGFGKAPITQKLIIRY